MAYCERSLNDASWLLFSMTCSTPDLSIFSLGAFRVVPFPGEMVDHPRASRLRF